MISNNKVEKSILLARDNVAGLTKPMKIVNAKTARMTVGIVSKKLLFSK